MAGTFKFELVSPERVLISADAQEVVIPGEEGQFTVLAGHAPVVTTLRPGALDILLAEGRKRVFVKRGFAEVDAGHVTVLAEEAVPFDELKGERLIAERKAAEDSLAGATDDTTRLLAASAIAALDSIDS